MTIEELEEQINDIINENANVRKLKCSCLDADVKDAIMSSNLDANLKQVFADVRTCSDIIEISNQEEYYEDELNAMKRRVKECDSRIAKE